MKALITAGGHAMRLRPITLNRNKHLIPLAGKSMLAFAIEKVVAAGITDIGININPGDTEIPAAIGDGSKFNCHLTYIEQQGGAKGLAHIVKNARDVGFLNGGSFLMYLGDNILLANIKKMIDRFETEHWNCMLALSRVPDPERFGVPEIVDGKIVSVEEKPKHPKSDFAVTGIYVYDEHALSAVDTLKPSARGEYEISDLNQYYIDQGLRVGYEEITGWWKDTGKAEDLLTGNQFILDEMRAEDVSVHPTVRIGDGVKIQGKVSIGEGTIISDNTLVRGPVVIGEHTIIRNSYIGPYTSIGNHVEILNTEIEHSIVFDKVLINCEKRIVDGIIGVGAKIISSNASLPHGHKLIVGDNSVVEL